MLPIYIRCSREKRYDVGIVPYRNCGILIVVNDVYFRLVIRCLTAYIITKYFY